MAFLKRIFRPLSPKLLFLLSLLCFGLFVFRMMAFTDGHRSVPLDDTFIHLQYAKQIAHGDYYRYQPGDPPTTGATSWLYVHLLAIPALFGISGKGLLTVAAFMNLVFLWLCLYYLGRLGENLYAPEVGFAAVLFCLSSGAFLWGIFSQMEIALFSFLLVLTAYYYQIFLSKKDGLGKLIFSATLLALSRPEGALIAILLTLLIGFQFNVRLWPKENIKPVRWSLLLFPVEALLAQTGLCWLLTGQMASSGYLAKSEFVSIYPFAEPQFMASCKRFWEILLFLMGLKSGQQDNLLYLVPGTLILFLIGTMNFFSRWVAWPLVGHAKGILPPLNLPLVKGEIERIAPLSNRETFEIAPLLNKEGLGEVNPVPGAIPDQSSCIPDRILFLRTLYPWLLLSVFGVAVVVSTVFCSNLHHWRYLLPLFPWLMLGMAGGLWKIAGFFGHRKLVVYAIFSVIVVGSGIYRWLDWANTFGGECGVHYKKHTQLARYIRNHLPPDAKIAVNDAGIIPYFSKRHCYDLVGLTTQGPTLPFRMGYGALAEYLENLPAKERFDYYAVFPSWFPSYETMGFFGEELYRVNDSYTSSRFEKRIFKAKWDWAGTGHAPCWIPPGWEIRDRLDVADLESEILHKYEILSDGMKKSPSDLHARMLVRPEGREDIEKNIFDAGWELYLLGERFVMHGLQPGKPARLLMRTGNITGEKDHYLAQIHVSIEGREVGALKLHPAPWSFSEVMLEIPAKYIRMSETTFEVHRDPEMYNNPYASYHYWILQPVLSGK